MFDNLLFHAALKTVGRALAKKTCSVSRCLARPLMKRGDVCEITYNVEALSVVSFAFACPALILFAKNGEQLASPSTFCSSDGVRLRFDQFSFFNSSWCLARSHGPMAAFCFCYERPEKSEIVALVSLSNVDKSPYHSLRPEMANGKRTLVLSPDFRN
jgi:hypothetical protein